MDKNMIEVDYDKFNETCKELVHLRDKVEKYEKGLIEIGQEIFSGYWAINEQDNTKEHKEGQRQGITKIAKLLNKLNDDVRNIK